MKETIIISGIVVLCVGTLWIGLWIAFRNMDKIVAQFRILATQYDFQLTIPSKWSWFAHDYPFAQGTYEGFEVTIDMFSIGSGQFKKTYTRVAIDRKYDNLPDFALCSSPALMINDAKEVIEKVKLGNLAFEEKYSLQAEESAVIMKLFDASLQESLIQADISGVISSDNGQLVCSIHYGMLHEGQRERVEKGIQCLVEIAKKIELLE